MRMSFLFPVTVKEKKDKKENNMLIMYLETRDKYIFQNVSEKLLTVFSQYIHCLHYPIRS